MKVRTTLGVAAALGLFALGVAPVHAAGAAAARPKLALQPEAAGKLRAVVPSEPRSAAQRDAFIRRILPRVGSTKAQFAMARQKGVSSILGKSLPMRPPKGGARPPRRLYGLDNNVTGDYYGWYGSQNEPSVAASPLDPNIVVAFAHNDLNFTLTTNACSIYLSFDAGQTFFYESDVPLAAAGNECAHPVARFSPDGFNLYLSYLDLDTVTGDDTLRVHVRDGQDPTSIVGTTDVFTGTGGDFVDKGWVDVHTWDLGSGQGFSGPGAEVVHVTATLFEDTGECSIIYNRSVDAGTTWDFGASGAVVSTSPSCSDSNPLLVRLLQGSRPAGGPGAQVLVCFFDAGADGWSGGFGDQGTANNRFNIGCRSSQDYGDTFTAVFNPALNVPYESAAFMGPNFGYQRLFGAGFPAIAIDRVGNAHLAYGADPNVNPRDAEGGNVLYQRSIFNATTNPQMLKWTARAGVGTGSGVQFFPTVVTLSPPEALLKPFVWLAYYDTKRSMSLGTANQNILYDVTTRFSVNGGQGFQKPLRITDVASLSDFNYIGDYLDGSANRRHFHVVWTDRADAVSIYSYEDDIFHDRFAPPGSN